MGEAARKSDQGTSAGAPAPTAAAAAAPTAAALIESASSTHTLPDGRAMTYVHCGAAGGSPGEAVLFLHPVQGNRLMALSMHSAASRLGLRLVAPDRPGYGGSSPLPGRVVGDHLADVADLLRALGIGRVGVLASSAGSMVRG